MQIRIPKVLGERIENLRKELPASTSVNSLAEQALTQMVTMMESNPRDRMFPDLLAQIDAVRNNRSRKLLLGEGLSSKVKAVGEEILDAGIEAVKRKSGR